MRIQWTRVLYSVVITGQSNPPISQFKSMCNECRSVWSMCVYNYNGTVFCVLLLFVAPYITDPSC